MAEDLFHVQFNEAEMALLSWGCIEIFISMWTIVFPWSQFHLNVWSKLLRVIISDGFLWTDDQEKQSLLSCKIKKILSDKQRLIGADNQHFWIIIN